MTATPRNNKRYQDLAHALRRKGKRDNLPCWICRQPIDYDLDPKHAMAYTYDHTDAISTGGDIRGEGKPAHRACNARRGPGRTVRTITATPTGIDWLAGPPDQHADTT